MKRTIRLISVVAIAMVLSIASSGVALASLPACTTPETSHVSTITQISCTGMVTEFEKVVWDSSNVDLLASPPLGDEETRGKMTYLQDLKVTDGITKLIKNLDVDTGSTPNLNVMKSIGYVQGVPGVYASIGSLSHDEEVSMGLVSNFVTTEDVVLCPFASAAQTILPASCEDVKASSSMVVTDVLATTTSKIVMSDSPVSLKYGITATGSAGAGTPAVGSIVAEFTVYTEEGSGAGGNTAGYCDGGVPANHTLGSTLSHYERSGANGLWEFNKQMSYVSVIRP